MKVDEEEKKGQFSPELLQKCGVVLKIENGSQYYEAFGGQVTWVGAPNAEKVYFRHRDEQGKIHGNWMDRIELI